MLRILDWWMVSKSWFYSRMRPNCQLDLLDTGGKGKYPVAALSARVASQDSARWVKIRGKAQIQGFGCYSTIAVLNKMRYTPLATDAHGGLFPRRPIPTEAYSLFPPEHLMLLRKAIYQILGCPHSSMIHSAIVQHLISFLNPTSKVFTICLW